MGPALVILAVILALVGIVISSPALAIAGCLCAILARIQQADQHHEQQMAALKHIEEAIAISKPTDTGGG